VKFYRLEIGSKPGPFATCFVTGTWGNEKYCKACSRYTGRGIVSPITIEWEPGYDRIGDFSWEPADYFLLVTRRARSVLVENGFECRFSRVEVKKPLSALKSKRPRVPFPYRGPKLFWVRPTQQVHRDINARTPVGSESNEVALASSVEIWGMNSGEIIS